ncbi:MAG: M28 family peptidase [Ruminococcaceae bacterium]|nr:M28 family peptidase [Oscillospiraceae bacterium]
MMTAQHVLAHHQVRKSKKQKEAFRAYVKEYAEGLGYSARVEKGSLGARNLIVGDPENARVVYTAHYDTCPRLPFPNFITPKSFLLYLLYQLLLVAAILLVFVAVGFALGFALGVLDGLVGLPEAVLTIAPSLIGLVSYVGVLWLLLAGPANRHTANDNTSGVVTLLEIMRLMPTERRGEAAFVFFDLEEVGLLGSMGFASRHPRVKKNTLLLNFDCVSDGDRILLALRKGAASERERLARCFAPTEGLSVQVLTRGVFYPSDQVCFQRGVGVAALKYSKLLRTEYMDRIHTNRDVIFQEKNIELLARGAVRLICGEDWQAEEPTEKE